MYVITSIVINISSSGINYENIEIGNKIKNVLIAVFLPVNGIIVMPYLANLLAKVYLNEIDNNKFKKRLIILIIIFIIILFMECSYLKGTQQGIINMINQK